MAMPPQLNGKDAHEKLIEEKVILFTRDGGFAFPKSRIRVHPNIVKHWEKNKLIRWTPSGFELIEE